MSKYSILIVEDHALTRFGLKTAFESDPDIKEVFEAANAKSGVDIATKKNVDVILMDLGLPDMSGIEAIKLIKEKHAGSKIVVLSSHEQEEDVIKSLKSGANAYCTKDIDPQKLIDITKSVLKGAAWFDPKVADYVLNAAGNTNKPSVTKKDSAKSDINLTSRETEVLSLIVEGYSNNDIAKKLEVSINTTKAHVCNILQKLSVNDRTQAAIKAIKDNLI